MNSVSFIRLLGVYLVVMEWQTFPGSRSKFGLVFLSYNMTATARAGSCDMLIFDSRLLCQTVSNTANKSINRSISWLSLVESHCCHLVVICSRDEVVERSGLKPCWSGAGWIYLLIVGRIRDYSTFAAGQRSADTRFLRRCPCQVSV